MSQEVLKIVSGVGAVAALFAAVLWFYASIIQVPDNIDTFIAALQRVSRVNAYGAMFATVAAVCASILFWFGRS